MFRSPLATVVVASVIAFVLPSLVFLGVALFEGMGVSGTLAAIVEQYSTPRQNLAVLGLVGVLPVALLGVVLWILRFFKRVQSHRPRLAIGGAMAILLVLTWVNFEFWPTFLPDKTYPGFPHGLEFVIGPLIFAPVAMVIGMLLAVFSLKKDT